MSGFEVMLAPVQGICNEMRQWLSWRGHSSTGRRADLVARIEALVHADAGSGINDEDACWNDDSEKFGAQHMQHAALHALSYKACTCLLQCESKAFPWFAREAVQCGRRYRR